MAKVTGQMAGQNGTVGQITYVTSGGETIARQKASNVKNPQTARQTAQRVIAKQVNMTYKKFKALCDHSFEGKSTGKECQARFLQVNMKNVRSRAAEIQREAGSLYQYFQFSPLSSEKWLPHAAILSEGSINRVPTGIVSPSGRNKGGFSALAFVTDHFEWVVGNGDVIASAVIVSRNTWWSRYGSPLDHEVWLFWYSEECHFFVSEYM